MPQMAEKTEPDAPPNCVLLPQVLDLSTGRSDRLKLHAAGRAIVPLPIDRIAPSPYQPRRAFSDASIDALAESIRRHGLLTPLLVRRVGAEQYELVAGERRLRALKRLGRERADAVVLSAYDRDCALLALIENLQRENLHYLDEAEAFRRILDEQSVTQEALAQSLSVSPSALANRLRLLKLPESVRRLLRQTSLTERHARALLRLSDEETQLALTREAADRAMSVQQLEKRIEQLRREARPQPSVSRVVRDNRIVINAVLDTVRELNRIGVRADSRVEEREGCVDVIVTIRTGDERS